MRTIPSLIALLFLFCVLICHGASCAAVQVSNRVASEEEVGYLPPPGDAPAVNPPAIAWLNEPRATSWTLQVARSLDFSDPVFTVRDWPWLMYTHTETLRPGTYYWRYRYATATAEGSGWSSVRDFTIGSSAVEFPRPSHQQLSSIISAAHPRMFMMPEKLAELRKAATPDNQAFTEFIQSADRSLTAPIMVEPKPWTGGKWNAGEWGEYLRQASAATAHMDALAFAWLLTGEKQYGDKAKAHLMEYVRWDPLGPSSMKINDEVGMPMLHSISRAYDWLYPLLSNSDKEQILTHMRGRGEETYDYMRKKPYEQFAYNSHFGRMFHFLGEAGLAFYGEIPEAEKWMNYAMTIFYGWYPFWGGENGGWAEGIHYWSSYNDRVTWWLDLMRDSLGIDGTRKPFYANVGDFPLYVCPPGSPVSGFGDFSEKPPHPNTIGRPLAAYALYRQNSAWQWYVEQVNAPVGLGPFLFLRSQMEKPAAAPPADAPLLKLFKEVGYALFHSDLAHTTNSIHVAMRCSPYGNVSHSHNDQNAIVMAAYGEPLLVNTGTRDFYGSPFCKEYYWTTQSHNSILFDGVGQLRSKETTGSYVAHGEQENLAYVVGDATNAYPEFVKLYRRWTIFLPDAGAVLIDEIKTTASTATLLFHGRTEFDVPDFPKTDDSFTLTKGDVTLDGKIHALGSSELVKFTQTDVYPVPLGNGKKPLFDEWHLKAEVHLSGDGSEVQRVVTYLGAQKNRGEVGSSAWKDIQVDNKLNLTWEDSRRGSTINLEIDLEKLTVKREK